MTLVLMDGDTPVKFKREVKADGSSGYRLNGRTKRYIFWFKVRMVQHLIPISCVYMQCG